MALLYFHGYPGSRGRLSRRRRGATRHSTHRRWPAGNGPLDAQASSPLVAWPDDVAALADHLAIDRFSVVGLSGGGPPALTGFRIA